MTSITESTAQAAALASLEAAGWGMACRPDIASAAPGAERADHGEVVLDRRLRLALARLTPGVPGEALEEAFCQLNPRQRAELLQRYRGPHRVLLDGVTVAYRDTELSPGRASV